MACTTSFKLLRGHTGMVVLLEAAGEADGLVG